VLCARAFAQQPDILLLDEPTAHLDLRHRIELLARVREFVAQGGSALVVSHDLDLAARTSDRLALLAGGQLVEVGPPGQVLRPEVLHQAFGIEAQVVAGPDGAPLVVPRTQ
jgi:iron complex transport system ATP-binding protein